MTEQDKEVQELRRENAALRAEIEALKNLRQLDMSEIAYQRRQIDFLLEVREGNG